MSTEQDRGKLISDYAELLEFIGYDNVNSAENVNIELRSILCRFMKAHQRVAIYCYGFHTKMLMTDFVSDIKDIVCVIDNEKEKNEEGFLIIRDEEIEKHEIDGVIVSSFKYKEQIKNNMRNEHPQVDVLDIYNALNERGIVLNAEYYSRGPYQIYSDINELNNNILMRKGDMVSNLQKLVYIYIKIKDFRMAIKTCQKLTASSEKSEDSLLLKRLNEIYHRQLELLANSSMNNVLMLCLDGMRGKDFLGSSFGQTRHILEKKGRVYTNAYSYSTMTFESLVPAFSENVDLRTGYYHTDVVEGDKCRLYKTAVSQNRKMYIYGDGCRYILGDDINYTGNAQTLTEKLWDYVLDAASVDNGLFYLHELHESHYSFPNPYTIGKMVANGTAMLFDYLPINGGKLQTDYEIQLKESLTYIDDTLAPFMEEIPCSMLLFADHGNYVVPNKMRFTDIKEIHLTAAEDWLRIPWVVVSKQMDIGEDSSLVTLLDINDTVISLLENRQYFPPQRRFIKFGRSPIYNPNFKKLYEMLNVGYSGEAFEGFIFDDGYKLIVFSDGKKTMYSISRDEIVNDIQLLQDRYNEIVSYITV